MRRELNCSIPPAMLGLGVLLLGLAMTYGGTQGVGVADRLGRQSTRLIHSVEGPDLFRAYCAPCHGLKAKGDGPAAPALKTKVPDLTLIARRNDGRFPINRVSKIIAGEDAMAAHGSRAMPVWGPIFHQVEADQDWGYVRLENLVKYLESIQQK